MNILEIKDFNISFEILGKKFKETEFQVVKDLSLKVKKGEIFTIVGSSGSGKSVFTSALFEILPTNAKVSGEIIFKGEKVSNLIKKAIFIPQSSSFLDPLMKVDKQICLSENELSKKTEGLYPFQCSGGMIRNAFFDLVHDDENAEIIIADEPTPGMDLETALKALSSLRKLADSGKSVILITHDIDLAIQISDKVAVFFDGTIVEIANSNDFSSGNLRHHYTKALYNALPQNGFKPIDLPIRNSENICFCSGICKKFSDKCKEKLTLVEVSDGFVRCANAPLW